MLYFHAPRLIRYIHWSVSDWQLSLAGPDLGWGPRGPGPQASHHRGASHQTAHILFLANDSADDFFIDVLLQFANVTMY